MNKLLSGRYLWAITGAVVFAGLSFMGKLTPEIVEKILLLIVTAYFVKQRKEG